MNRVEDWLRLGDPLAFEAEPRGAERARVRAAILQAVDARAKPSRRRVALPVVLAGLVTAAIGATLLIAMWPAVEAPTFAAVRVEIRLAEDAPAPGLTAAPVGRLSHVVYLHDEVVVTNEDITSCLVVPGSVPDRFGVEFRFSAGASDRLREATRRHRGSPLAVLIDGHVVAAPRVQSEIGDLGTLSGDFDRNAADRIARGVIGK